jgi:hypothetical protein
VPRLPLALALLLTLLNAGKPLHVDDGFFWQYARQNAVAPSDPYGFLSWLDERPEPANQMLAPPGLPYWWAIGMRLFGERPLLWKLWLFPLVWLFTHSLHLLLQRFAAGLEQPLLVLAALSPVVLPAINLMLDIPALALGLCAFRLYLQASDALERGAAAHRIALAAGVVAAFAIQTKYTALLLPAVLLGHALLFGRLRLWALLAGVTAALCVAWESFIAARYGQSHFVYHYYANHSVWTEKLAFATPLFPLLGALGPGLLLLGLVALRRARAAALAAVSVPAVFLAVALVPEAAATFAPGAPPKQEPLTLAFVLFAVLGAATLLTLAAGAARLLRQADRLDVFLVYWLGLELAGYFAMSPFPAARRVLGLFVASVAVLGRLATRTLSGPDRRRLLRLPVVVSALAGLLFFAVDFHEAWQTRRIVERAADWIRPRRAPGARVFYVGHWAFQYYAERAGMIAAVDRQFYRRTILRRGDFLVVPGPRIAQQRFWIDPERSEPAQSLRSVDALPLRTLHCFYQGRTPLERHDGARMEVTVYRVLDEFPTRPFRGHATPGS